VQVGLLLLALGQQALTDLILYFLRLPLLGVAKEGNTGIQQVQRGQAVDLVVAVGLVKVGQQVVVVLEIPLILLRRKVVMEGLAQNQGPVGAVERLL
jgi:hypothetical protein